MAIGAQAYIDPLIGDKTKVIDLEGKFVMPGMGDLHQHWDMGPLQEKQGWLKVPGQPPAPEELKKIILEYVTQNRDKEWVIGRNGSWFDEMFAAAGVKAGYEWLDSFIPDQPVALQDVQGHIIMANSRAMELAGITDQTPDPTNGVIMRDDNGKPTGVFSDGVQTLVMRSWPIPSHRLHVQTFYEQSRMMNSFGLTMVKLVHSRIPSLEALRELDVKYKIHLWLDVFTSWKSDYTVGSSPRPLEAMENYITRKRPSDTISVIPSSSDEPMGEGIELEDAIKILTINCAKTMGRQDRTGSLEVGKSADFVVLGNNLFEIQPEQISGTPVLKTVFEGATVFDASKENPYNEKLYLDRGKLEKGCFC